MVLVGPVWPIILGARTAKKIRRATNILKIGIFSYGVLKIRNMLKKRKKAKREEVQAKQIDEMYTAFQKEQAQKKH